MRSGRLVTYGVLLVVAVVAGIFVGRIIGSKVSPQGGGAHFASMSALQVGASFPAIDLDDPYGGSISSAELPGDDGVVVLFIDTECPPCTDMVKRWQRAIDEGVVEPGQVAGVSYHVREVIDDYCDENGVTFPVYRDGGQVFRSEYKVDRFPLEVIVGKSGLVRSTSYDSVSPIEPGEVAAALGD